MISVNAAQRQSRPGLAIGAGVLAAVVTLAAVTGLLWLAGGSGDDVASGQGASGRVGDVVTAAELQPEDCMNFTTAGAVARFTIIDCAAPHIAQVTARIAHPDAGGVYPGADAMTEWVGTRCGEQVEAFIGGPILETTLASGRILPDFNTWSAGDDSATCYVRLFDSTSLVGSLAGRGGDFPRTDDVVVSRLIEGDCFVPTQGTNSYDLNSNSPVVVVPCDGEHNGVFFGRDRLDEPISSLFPGEDVVGDATSRRCGELFSDHFGVPSAGFNYRYWRPNQQSWDLDDRTILCAVLDADPLTERFDPSEYEPFYELAIGRCFNLGPEETSDSLRLDDQVRVIGCTEPHVGQMIGSGELDVEPTDPFPADDGVQQLAGSECERLFVDFVGASPFESELGKFPFWYPNEPGWEDGDRRYACAFLESEPRTESLENAGA